MRIVGAGPSVQLISSIEDVEDRFLDWQMFSLRRRLEIQAG